MKIKIILFIVLFTFINVKSQTIIAIPTVIQEQTQWCWAGSTKSILNYYGNSYQQCQIAEYTRTVSTWNNYGSINCCLSPTSGCNYWNYNYGSTGSMEDILITLGSINNSGYGSSLSVNQITTEIAAGRPFIIRWGWTSGGGHFIVGKGIDNLNNIYYMNPWPGEGSKVSTYSWMLNDGSHTWTHTNVLTTNPPLSTNISSVKSEESINIFPNPALNNLNIQLKNNAVGTVYLYNVNGDLILENNINTQIKINTTAMTRGFYLIKICLPEQSFYKKIVLN